MQNNEDPYLSWSAFFEIFKNIKLLTVYYSTKLKAGVQIERGR